MQHFGKAKVLHVEPLRAKHELKWGETPYYMQHFYEVKVLHVEPLRAKHELKWGETPY